jgi:hypothetical protein
MIFIRNEEERIIEKANNPILSTALLPHEIHLAQYYTRVSFW